MTGVASDLGVHDDPDSWYAAAGTDLSGPRAWLYRRVRAIRAAARRGVDVRAVTAVG